MAVDVRRSVKKITLVTMLPFAQLAAQQRTVPAERFPAELDRYIESVRAQWEIPGIAIAVVRNDSTLIAKGYGVRQLGKPERVDENTVFDIASLSKAFTATAAAMLVDRGVLQWDDPVTRYLPNLALPNDTLTRQATTRDFLSHRTGIDPANMMWVPTAVKRDEVLRRMRYLRVVGPFRQTMTYSNIGYSVAGEAAAAAAKMPFESMIRDLVIKPLGLTSTTWTYEQSAGMPNIASSHANIGGKQQVIPRERQRQAIAPAAAVQSTVHDLTRWMRLHLNNGVLDGKRFVSDSTMRVMHSVQSRIPTTPAMRAARMVQDTIAGYGLGWQVMDYRGHRLLWHTGNGDGQIAFMALYPDDRLGIVALVNTWSAPNVHGALINRIADAYLGFEPRDWAREGFWRVTAQNNSSPALDSVMAAMRSSAPSRLPLSAFAGRYDHPVFGPIWIRSESTGLTLQMGDGRVADLEYHGNDAFYVLWRDPFFREYYGTHVAFGVTGDSVASFTTTLNRDVFTARKGAVATTASPWDTPRAVAPDAAITGRWDLRMLASPNVSSSWLEVERSGATSFVGRFVGLIGRARPIANLEWKRGVARFVIPTQWETPAGDLRVEVRPSGDSLVGTMVWPDGTMRALVGRRAPILRKPTPARWSDPTPLFNGKDLTGWVSAPTQGSLPNFWVVRDGVLANTADYGMNLMTVERFQDFKLHAEFRLPPRSTSGIFPRGRYWVMLQDAADTVPFRGTTGAVNGFLVPTVDASLGPDVWQSIDVILVGRRITVMVNGRTVIADQDIPGVTGSAVDSDEGAPGPIMLQGEERKVEFRNITISVPVAGLS